MPTYAYACTECEHKFDAVQSFTDDALTTCPQCSGRLRKLFAAVGIVFKGSGFYRNDSRAAASGNGSKAKPDTGSDGGKESGSTADAAKSGSDSSAKPNGTGSTGKTDSAGTASGASSNPSSSQSSTTSSAKSAS